MPTRPRLAALRAIAAGALLFACGAAHAQTNDTADSTRKGRLGAPHVFGYAQVFYRYAFATGEDSLVDFDNFRVQRVRIGVEGQINEWASYDVEFDPRAPQISTVLRDAFLRLRVIPRHQIRIGQQKTPFGFENRESSSDLYTVNRAEVSDNLARGINLRDIGVGLMGNVKLGKGLRLEDDVALVNGAGMNVQADDNRRKNVFGRLGLRWRDDAADRLVRIGASGAYGDLFDTGDDPVDPADDFRLFFTRYGADLEVDSRTGFLAAEWVSGREEDQSTHETDEPQGWYVTLVGKLPHRMGPIFRYDDFDDEWKRYTLGAYWGLPSEPLRFLLNYEYRRANMGVRGDDKLYLWTQVRF